MSGAAATGAPAGAVRSRTLRFVGGAVGLSIVSRLLGVAREGAIVGLLGVHPYTDAYFATSSVPLWLQSWSFGALLLSLVPRYLALPIGERPSFLARRGRRALLGGLLAGGAFFLAYGRLEALMLSGRAVLGPVPALLLASAIPCTMVGGVLYGCVVATTRGILVAAAATLGSNLVGLATLLAVVGARLDPASALPASLAATQLSLVLALWRGARLVAGDEPRCAARGGAVRGEQVAATTAENLGFNASAVVQQGIAGHLGPGAVSMNAYATRLLLIPLTGLLTPLQQRLLIHYSTETPEGARRAARWSVVLGLLAGFGAGGALALALGVSAPAWPAGWQAAFEEHQFTLVLLAYGGYGGVVFSNQSLARLLFAQGRGWAYAVPMLAAHAVGTLGRLSLAPGHGILALPATAVAAEGAALAWFAWVAGLWSGRAGPPGRRS